MSNLSMQVMPTMGSGAALPADQPQGSGDSAFGDTLCRMADESGGAPVLPTALQVGSQPAAPDDSPPDCLCGSTNRAEPEAWVLPVMPSDPLPPPSPGALDLATFLHDPNGPIEQIGMPVTPRVAESSFLPKDGSGVHSAGPGGVVLQGPGFTPDDSLPPSPDVWFEKAAMPAKGDPAEFLRTTGTGDPDATLFPADADGFDPALSARLPGIFRKLPVLSGAFGRSFSGLPDGFLEAMFNGIGPQPGRPQGVSTQTTALVESVGPAVDGVPETSEGVAAPMPDGHSAVEAQRAVRAYGMPDPLQQIRRVGPDGQALSIGDGASGVRAREPGASAIEGATHVPVLAGDDGTLEDLADQVRAQLRVMAARGRERVTLQLHPASLGKLKLQVSLEKHSVVAEMMTDSTAVRDLVNGQLQTLKEALMEQGFHLERFEVHLREEAVGQGSRDTGSTFREAFRESLGDRPEGGAPNPQMPPVHSRSGESITPEGRVNLFV